MKFDEKKISKGRKQACYAMASEFLKPFSVSIEESFPLSSFDSSNFEISYLVSVEVLPFVGKALRKKHGNLAEFNFLGDDFQSSMLDVSPEKLSNLIEKYPDDKILNEQINITYNRWHRLFKDYPETHAKSELSNFLFEKKKSIDGSKKIDPHGEQFNSSWRLVERIDNYEEFKNESQSTPLDLFHSSDYYRKVVDKNIQKTVVKDVDHIIEKVFGKENPLKRVWNRFRYSKNEKNKTVDDAVAVTRALAKDIENGNWSSSKDLMSLLNALPETKELLNKTSPQKKKSIERQQQTYMSEQPIELVDILQRAQDSSEEELTPPTDSTVQVIDNISTPQGIFTPSTDSTVQGIENISVSHETFTPSTDSTVQVIQNKSTPQGIFTPSTDSTAQVIQNKSTSQGIFTPSTNSTVQVIQNKSTPQGIFTPSTDSTVQVIQNKSTPQGIFTPSTNSTAQVIQNKSTPQGIFTPSTIQPLTPTSSTAGKPSAAKSDAKKSAVLVLPPQTQVSISGGSKSSCSWLRRLCLCKEPIKWKIDKLDIL